MNRTIKLLLLSEIFVMTGFGLIEPILAIYINGNIAGGTIFAAGLASMLFLMTKSVVQLPFSKYVDSHNKKITWLIIGTFIITLVPFVYIFASDITTIYIAQIIHGIGSALAYPTWLSLWGTNLDKNKEGFEWSLYSTLTGIGTAATAAVGAAISEFIGFAATFVIVGLMSLIGCGILFALEEKAERTKKAFTKDYREPIEERF